MEVVGLITSVVSIVGVIVGYVVWLRKQRSPRGKLQQAIEDAFARQEKDANPDDMARTSFDRRQRVKQLLDSFRKVPPRK